MRYTKEETIQLLLDNRIKFATVSGIWSTKPSIIEEIDRNIPEIDIITTKSYQVSPNPGNREPIIVEVEAGSYGNAVGLRNPGMEQGFEDLRKLRDSRHMRSLLSISLSASSIEDFITLVRKFEDVADILELNFSCPHAKEGYGASIGSDPEVVREYVRAIAAVHLKVPFFVKLTPNVPNIGEIAKTAVGAGADGISAVNTVGPEVYLESFTGEPILNNKRGNAGGKSGSWIRGTALRKIAEIRKAIGDNVPIIGMGGVVTGEDVRSIIRAGANVVGLGSVFAMVPAESRKSFIAALKNDAQDGTTGASAFLNKKRQMEYKPYKIREIRQVGEDLKIFTLEGCIDYHASQFVFLWVPGVGEKPYTIVRNNPLTLLVRKREYDPDRERGLVSNALFKLKPDQYLMIRGTYGKKPIENKMQNAFIVAGGTGIAVVPKLAQELLEAGKRVTVFFGVTAEKQAEFAGWIDPGAAVHVVPDNGKPGRVLEVLETTLTSTDTRNGSEASENSGKTGDSENTENTERSDNSGVAISSDTCFYNIGPNPLMRKAMELEERMGVDTHNIYCCLETNNMCGIGICGECECGGRLTCQEGTFFSAQFLKKACCCVINEGSSERSDLLNAEFSLFYVLPV